MAPALPRFLALCALGLGLLWLPPSAAFAQSNGTITGQVLADDGSSLPGANIGLVGSVIGTTTDIDGRYRLSVRPGTYTVEARYVGFSSAQQTVSVAAGETATADFTLTESVAAFGEEVVVLGSRTNRTAVDTPVPVDVLNVSMLSTAAPQTNLNQLLHSVAPAFSSNTQTISDGTDHIDPASLRGLGPDQVLVLLNGKRRHTTSLVNVNGTFGRGNVGTDLNAIPSTAVEMIEVLRDGAAAQYGSDAIAGVINVRLKDDVNKLTANVTTGANFTNEIGPFGGETADVDGEVFNLGINYGLPLGDAGGFVNFTGEFDYRGSTNRMQEFSGGIFNALNAVERVAMNQGLDVSSLSMQQLQSLSQNVGYFSSDFKTDIANAPDMDALAGLLGTDVTTDELNARGLTRSDFNMRVGQSAVRGGRFFGNMALPVGEELDVYSFGGISYREGESGCFYRLPSQSRTTTAIYPNGTVPRINSNIHDRSVAMGLRGKMKNWNVDLSNTWGYNSFGFYMTHTHNATLGPSSPTTFDSGGHSFMQNTANFDASQYFQEAGGLLGVNVAFGAEYRFENFQETPGTELSWGNYDVNGNLVNPATPDALLTRDLLGRARPSGAQCFAGFLPTNDVDANRSSVAGYVDFEFDLTQALLVSTAVRFENYSDFGSTFNYKVAGRYKLTDDIAVRGALSTGFRAPSLHQIHFSRTSTIFELVNGVSVAQERGTFANTSRAAKLLGIPELKEETSRSYSLGFTTRLPEMGLRLTVDAYLVDIDDRVILTGAFSAQGDAELTQIFEQAGATAASFFANAIDTRSRGLDVVIAHRMAVMDNALLSNNLAATFSKTEWDQDAGIKASALLREKGLVDTYFDQTSRIYLEEAVPRTKLTLSNTLSLDRLDVYLRNTYFGETTEATNEAIFDANLKQTDNSIDPYYSGKIVTDLSVSYGVSSALSLTVGANNLLDVYPDEADPAFQSSGRFLYSRRSPQFSYSGRHLFARLLFVIQ